MKCSTCLALVLPLAACSEAHDPGDSGVGMDAPGCSPRPTAYLDIECPSPESGATSAIVSITSSPTVCCGAGTVTPTVTRRTVSPTDHTFDIDLAWNACDCCEACRCVGPIETTMVTLDGLEPGHHYTVTAGTSTCSFALSPFTHCPRQEVGAVRMPRVVLNGDALPVTLQSVVTPGGCSCTPALSAPFDTLAVGIVACECCVDCECIDYLYEVSGERAAPPPGDHTVAILSPTPSSRPLAVRDLSSCRSGNEPLALEVVGPTPEATHNGPLWWWLHATGAELVCCAEPLPALRALEAMPGSELVFEPLTCTADPCDCVPKEPTRWETWAPLGELAPGSYRVTVGAAFADFSVPVGP